MIRHAKPAACFTEARGRIAAQRAINRQRTVWVWRMIHLSFLSALHFAIAAGFANRGVGGRDQFSYDVAARASGEREIGSNGRPG
jgi:hypothetical protein